jgi:hypothetical protein
LANRSASSGRKFNADALIAQRPPQFGGGGVGDQQSIDDCETRRVRDCSVKPVMRLADAVHFPFTIRRHFIHGAPLGSQPSSDGSARRDVRDRQPPSHTSVNP